MLSEFKNNLQELGVLRGNRNNNKDNAEGTGTCCTGAIELLSYKEDRGVRGGQITRE